MVGIQERATAASAEFKTTVTGLTKATKDCVHVVFDRNSSGFAVINGALYAVTIPIVMLPLAAGEAARAFIKPPDKG